MKVLVTGGLGFQGSHLVETLLNRGDEITILTTPSVRNTARWNLLNISRRLALTPANLNVVLGSVADAEILEKTIPGHDAVVHMAAWTSVDVSLDRPWPPFEINAHGTLCLLEACRRFGKRELRVVVASSCEVYGPTQRFGLGEVAYERQNESWPLEPRSPYAASKIAADRMAYAYAVTYDMDVVIVRPCNVYGPGQRSGAMGAVIPTFTQAAFDHKPMAVTGNGNQFREFLYVSDLVAAYVTILERKHRDKPGSTYNVGSGETKEIVEIARMIRTAVNPAGEIVHSAARAADVSGFLLDSSKFQARYGWKRQVPFHTGLATYISWARVQHESGNPL